MSTLTAAQLLAQLRQNAAPIQTTATRTNTKSPISEPDQKTIRAYIEQHEPAWLLAFYDVSLETGWRTADVANLRYDAIDWDAGTLRITVAKQTKAAQARALAKGLKEIRESRQSAALAAGDAVAYMQWGASSRDELAALHVDPERSYVLASQTTQDRSVFEQLEKELRDRLPRLKVLATICDATRERQEEARSIAARVDAKVVVGGRQSGNTRRLADLAAQSGISTYHIEQAEELRAEDFAGKGRVGLTAGASTPRKLIDATQQWLEQLPD